MPADWPWTDSTRSTQQLEGVASLDQRLPFRRQPLQLDGFDLAAVLLPLRAPLASFLETSTGRIAQQIFLRTMFRCKRSCSIQAKYSLALVGEQTIVRDNKLCLSKGR
ncbi:hypothetical protein ACVWZR_005338 [Bradyrhizobium sp. i1.3.1]